jgi:hypothetical protein
MRSTKNRPAINALDMPVVDNRLTDGVKVVSLTHRPAALYPQKDSWYSFLLESESTAGS